MYLEGAVGKPDHLFWGIYDGHCGHMVSAALQQNFYSKLLAAGCFVPDLSESELRDRIRSVYLETDAKLCALLRAEKSGRKRKPGSCCTAVWLIGSRLIVTHVGDSRVVMW